MTEALWQDLTAALERAEQVGRTVTIWFRDDDAVTVTPALDRLAALARTHRVPVLLAVIPQGADSTLKRFVEAEPLLSVAQHGLSHTNHAAAGERAREIGGARPVDHVDSDLRTGRDLLRTLFGPNSAEILVPPWNRIDDQLLPGLPGLGYKVLSTFGSAQPNVPGLLMLPCTLDIIDWRHGRRCHPHQKLSAKLAALVLDAVETNQPIGLLTHHLAHDEEAWTFLEACLRKLAASPVIRFATARRLCGLE